MLASVKEKASESAGARKGAPIEAGAPALQVLKSRPGPACYRNALHPTRRDACRSELGGYPAREASRGVESSG
jgi:hypothetical protein